MDFTVDISHLPLETRRAIVRTVREESAARRALAMQRQLMIKQQYDRAAQLGTTKDGFGPVTEAWDSAYMSYIREVYGDDTFDDPDKRKWALRHTPEAKVRPYGTKIQVGFTGGSSPVGSRLIGSHAIGGAPRFHKSYN